MRCVAVASSSRGYQTSGTVMTRPSRRLTLIASSVNWTSSTRSSVLLCADDAEKLIPCLQKPLPRIPHHRLYLAQFVGAKSKVARQLDGTKPEFSRQIVAVNMNIWRLVGLVTVEVEAIRAGSQPRRHPGILPKHSGKPRSLGPKQTAFILTSVSIAC